MVKLTKGGDLIQDDKKCDHCLLQFGKVNVKPVAYQARSSGMPWIVGIPYVEYPHVANPVVHEPGVRPGEVSVVYMDEKIYLERSLCLTGLLLILRGLSWKLLLRMVISFKAFQPVKLLSLESFMLVEPQLHQDFSHMLTDFLPQRKPHTLISLIKPNKI